MGMFGGCQYAEFSHPANPLERNDPVGVPRTPFCSPVFLMVLRSLHMESFRAHDDSRFSFVPQINLIGGTNGVGKTNIIEAIHYLCLSKSFLAKKDVLAVRHGCSWFQLRGEFEGDRRARLSVRTAYSKTEGKRVFVNGAGLDRIAEFVGTIPVVIYSHLDQALTSGGPEPRRRFLNNVLSQSRPVYLGDLIKYRRVLRQRNELLSRLRNSNVKKQGSEIVSWDRVLIHWGSRLIWARMKFLEEFSDFLERAYKLMGIADDHPAISYTSVGRLDKSVSETEVQEAFAARIQKVAHREMQQGYTAVGPHRDELVFTLNGQLLRDYASQGQHRSFLLAIKLAQYMYLFERLDEHPIMLLDDVFDTLDGARVQVILKILQQDWFGQSFITSAQPDGLAKYVDFADSHNQQFRIEAGKLVQDANNKPHGSDV